MSRHLIAISQLGHSFSHKICFSEFSTEVFSGQRIGIVGQNGSGKSTLLHIIRGAIEPSEGWVRLFPNTSLGYIPQLITEHNWLSGGERFNKELSAVLFRQPEILLLDEPTNHLDRRNRANLLRMLSNYPGTLLAVSHDVELLRNNVDVIWQIANGKITIFSGNYDDFKRESQYQLSRIEQQLTSLEREKKINHEALMQEQERAKKSRVQGEKSIKNRKWPGVVSAAKARRAEETSGKKRSQLSEKRYQLIEELGERRLPEVIRPQFHLSSQRADGRLVVSILNGGIGYEKIFLKDIQLRLGGKDKIALIGANGSGKTTVVRAIMGDAAVKKTGDWQVPFIKDIGYLDQHYATLLPHQTVMEAVAGKVPAWSIAELRKHLNAFLFRKNEEVNAKVSSLSGGEKARLVLAQIAACPPRLLILDELTNNLDLETREHLIEILKGYPGAMIVISHDDDFIEQLGLEKKELLS